MEGSGRAGSKAPRFAGSFARDASTATRIWRANASELAALPPKPQRTSEQQQAADAILAQGRASREQFLTHHAEAVYRKLTKNLTVFLRVDDLAYAAAKLVPGLTPTRDAVDVELDRLQSEKDGIEVDQGLVIAHVLALPDCGLHLCEAMLQPKPEAIERARTNSPARARSTSARRGWSGAARPRW